MQKLLDEFFEHSKRQVLRLKPGDLQGCKLDPRGYITTEWGLVYLRNMLETQDKIIVIEKDLNPDEEYCKWLGINQNFWNGIPNAKWIKMNPQASYFNVRLDVEKEFAQWMSTGQEIFAEVRHALTPGNDNVIGVWRREAVLSKVPTIDAQIEALHVAYQDRLAFKWFRVDHVIDFGYKMYPQVELGFDQWLLAHLTDELTFGKSHLRAVTADVKNALQSGNPWATFNNRKNVVEMLSEADLRMNKLYDLYLRSLPTEPVITAPIDSTCASAVVTPVITAPIDSTCASAAVAPVITAPIDSTCASAVITPVITAPIDSTCASAVITPVITAPIDSTPTDPVITVPIDSTCKSTAVTPVITAPIEAICTYAAIPPIDSTSAPSIPTVAEPEPRPWITASIDGVKISFRITVPKELIVFAKKRGLAGHQV